MGQPSCREHAYDALKCVYASADQVLGHSLSQTGRFNVYMLSVFNLSEKNHHSSFCHSGPASLQPPARPSTGFLKPSSGEEDSGHQSMKDPAWKKPAQESAIQLQEKERDAGKTPPRGDKAAVTSSRFEYLGCVMMMYDKP